MLYQRFTALLAGWLMAGCVASASQGAIVHTTTLPPGVPVDFRQKGDFLYLEIESATQAAADTNNDALKTVFSSLQSDCCWGSATPDGARWGNRGSGSQSSLSASLYWVDLPAPQAGLWDVYLRHSLTSSVSDTTKLKSSTDTFYVGTGYSNSTSQQSLLDQTFVGSSTISNYAATPQILQWDYLGRIALDGSTQDTFRLKMDVVWALQRADTVLMVRLPEPAAALSLAIGALGLAACRKRATGVRASLKKLEEQRRWPCM